MARKDTMWAANARIRIWRSSDLAIWRFARLPEEQITQSPDRQIIRASLNK